MRVREHDIGVCSWSLRPEDTADLLNKVKRLELEHVQLGLSPLLSSEGAAAATVAEEHRARGITIVATMITFAGEDYTSVATIRRTGGLVPDEQWPDRRDLTLRAGKLTAELGVKFLTCHIGFVPPSSDPTYLVMVERVRDVAQALASDNLSLLLETGQESASELLQFLNDLNCRNVGVNFDPANMILYGGGDPIEAISILNRHIRHVHVKDAVASSQPRLQWGKEVVFGTGEVDPLRFLDALDDIGYTGLLTIEREAPGDPLADARAAIKALKEAE